MKQQHGQVVIGPDFFQKEIKNYTRWDFAWGREVGQNSLDAGAGSIVIEVMRHPVTNKVDGSECRVIWVDDGCGMDLDILINKFLTLGESHKRKGAVGGFGWAKTLILFAQTNYRILSGDIVLEGCGGSYSYTEGNDYVGGCIIEVVLPRASSCIQHNIREWARWTDTKGCSITLNGEKIPTFADAKVKGRKELPMKWATMQVVECEENNGSDIYFRINGQMMSASYLPDNVKDNIVIDIIGDSTQYFTANRDQLQWEYRNVMNEFIKNLYRDPKSVAKVNEPIHLLMLGGRGDIEIGITDQDKADRLQAILDNPELMAAILSDTTGVVHDGWNILIINETDKNIPEKWMPGMWNKYAVKLMARWIGCVVLVGECIGYKGKIVPGWFFSTDSVAGWNSDAGAMVLNPVHINIATGKMTNRFKLDNDGFLNLVLHCIHEYVHAQGFKYHDEDFLTRYETNIKKVMQNWASFKLLRRKV